MKLLKLFVLTTLLGSLALPGKADAITVSLDPDSSTLANYSYFSLRIKIDQADGIAGAAFTVNYPSDAVELDTNPVSTPFFKTLSVSSSTETITPWQANTDNTGKVMLSGAYINTDPTTGGGGNYAGPQTLFNIKFKVKTDAQVGNYSFTISATSLFNPQAGWGSDVNGNGVYDAGDDQYEDSPLLVKAFPKGSAQWETPTLTDDFVAITAIDSIDGVISIVAELDTDNDGTQNNLDADDDGDGVADAEDALPYNKDETADCDGDGVGNNADLDDDNDGVLDVDDLFPCDDTRGSGSLDVDGDSDADANDGVMIQRRLTGAGTVITGIVLPTGVGGEEEGGVRSNAQVIEAIDNMNTSCDVDGDSDADANDGVMIQRRLTGAGTVTTGIVLPQNVSGQGTNGARTNEEVIKCIDDLKP